MLQNTAAAVRVVIGTKAVRLATLCRRLSLDWSIVYTSAAVVRACVVTVPIVDYEKYVPGVGHQ